MGYVVVSLGLVCVGGLYYQQEKDEILDKNYHELAAISELKVGQIEEWRQARRMTIKRLIHRNQTRQLVGDFLTQTGNAQARAALRAYLETQRAEDEAEDVQLLGLDNSILLAASDEPLPLGAESPAVIAAAKASGQPVLGSFYRNIDGAVNLDTAGVLSDARGEPLAVLLVRRNVRQDLFSFLQKWPIPSETAETILCQQEGAGLVYVNEPRHDKNNLLVRRIGQSETNLPAVQARLGRTGRFEGVDYDGVPVMADLQPIPGSPWFIIAQMDMAEVMTEAKYRFAEIATIIGLFLGLGIVGGLYHEYGLRLFQRLLTADQEKLAVQARYQKLFAVVEEAILVVDCETCQLTDVNLAAEKMYGYRRHEFLALKAMDLSAEPEKTFAAIAEDKKDIPVRWHRKKDGTVFSVEISCNSFMETGRKWHVAAIRDITSRQIHQQALEQTNSLLNATLESTADGILVVDVAGKVASYNQKFLELWRIDAALLATRNDAQFDGQLLRQVMAQLSDPDQFIAKVQELYRDPHAASWDELRFRDGRIFERYTQPHRLGDAVVGRVWSFREITARKLAEQAVILSEQRLTQLAEHSSTIAWEVDAQGLYTYISPVCRNVLGFQPEEIIGKKYFYDLHPETGREEFKMAALNVFERKGLLRNLINPAMTKGGQLIWLSTNGLPLLDADGALRGYRGSDTDVTEQKQAEVALRREQEFNRTLLENIPAFVFWKDCDLNYVGCNRVFALAAGLTSPAEVVGKSDFDLAWQHSAEAYRRVDRQVIESKTARLGFEEEQVRPDGSVIWFKTSKTPLINREGKVVGLLAVSMDITETKQSQQQLIRLATAVQQAAEAIVMTDTRGNIVYVNPAFERVTGYASAEVLGRNPRVLKSGNHDRQFYERLWAVITAGEVWSGRLVNRRKDGANFHEEANITPIRDNSGRIVNYVAVKRDVTREVQLENQFHQAQKMEAIGTLAGGIAHDFNNILAAMLGYTYLLQQDTEGNGAAQESIREILAAAGRAKDLVQQILTFSRQRDQKREIIQLNTVVKEVCKFLRASTPANIQLQLQIADDAPPVLADPTQIYQVAMNLGANALHAMDGQNGSLTIRLEAFQPDAEFLALNPQCAAGDHVCLTVADTGHGMDEKTRQRIFEPFFTTKPLGKGTGLGLAVVHGIVKSHAGFITVESVPGGGSTFRIYLPARSAEVVADNVKMNPALQGARQKILVLDDEESLTRMYERLLRRLNYQVTVCTQAGDAIRQFSADSAQFDLFITDLTMPEMNGLDVARQLHELRADIPIILASGFSCELTAETLQAAGIALLIEKPVNLNTLAEAVHDILMKPRM